MPSSFNPEESSQYSSMLQSLIEEGGQAADEEARDAEGMDGDDDLQMERGNDLAPNRVCPLSMKEVRPVNSSSLAGYLPLCLPIVPLASACVIPLIQGRKLIYKQEHCISLSTPLPLPSYCNWLYQEDTLQEARL